MMKMVKEKETQENIFNFTIEFKLSWEFLPQLFPISKLNEKANKLSTVHNYLELFATKRSCLRVCMRKEKYISVFFLIAEVTTCISNQQLQRMRPQVSQLMYLASHFNAIKVCFNVAGQISMSTFPLL